VLSSIAVLWTAVSIIGLIGMSSMMATVMMGMRGPDGMMGGALMMGMMLRMVLTWLVMLGLDGVFIYLVVTGRRHAGHQTAVRPRQAA
jgi:uncharacterized membrane protein